MENRRLKTIFYIRIVILLIVVYFVAVGFYYSYYYFFEPAWASVVDACEIESPVNDKYVTIGTYTPSTNEIYVVTPRSYLESYDNSWQARNEYMKTKKYHRVVMHERIHRWQMDHNRLNNNCNQLVRFWLDEVEAYIGMYLPRDIYNFFYS